MTEFFQRFKIAPAVTGTLAGHLDEFCASRNDDTDEVKFPSIWCPWRLSDDGKWIESDPCEGTFNYEAWLVYLIDIFLEPAGHVVNGLSKWKREDNVSPKGVLVVVDNMVTNHTPRFYPYKVFVEGAFGKMTVDVTSGYIIKTRIYGPVAGYDNIERFNVGEYSRTKGLPTEGLIIPITDIGYWHPVRYEYPFTRNPEYIKK